MNSGTKIIGGLSLVLGVMLLFGSRPSNLDQEVSIAPSEFNRPEPLDIKPKISKQWYKYRVEIETIPENQLYKIEKSGYQQYEISRLGESYSYVTYEFTSDKVMTTEEAYEFVKRHPEKCTRVPNTKTENIYDRYNDEYENYINDPEDEINYPPEVFDFLAD